MVEGQQRSRSEDLQDHALTRVEIRMAHLLEVHTGYRSGSRFWALPGEPKPEYDLEDTTLTERRRAKVAELRGLDRREAKHLGLEWISERTLKRMAAQYAEHGLMGLADGRWTPPLRGRRMVGEEVAEAIRAVHAECLHRSKVSMKTKERLIHRVPPKMPRPSGRGGIGLLRSRAGIAGSPSGRSGVHP
ncbi:hypothetical protein ACIBJF_52290, partial [Streptomyces sp. NPDC050743]